MLHRSRLRLSIVIPIALHEKAWPRLLAQLACYASQEEWLLVVPLTADEEMMQSLRQAELHYPALRLVQSLKGRAIQINAGIAAAREPYLWILHADTELPPLALVKLKESLARDPYALHYFDLGFSKPASFLMELNSLGVRLRSDCFKMPFGDQGFAFHRELWRGGDGFPTDLSYGEDHVFVWRLRQRGIRLRRVPVKLYTSARKYEARGWLATTALHLRLTFIQAKPEWQKLWRLRLQHWHKKG